MSLMLLLLMLLLMTTTMMMMILMMWRVMMTCRAGDGGAHSTSYKDNAAAMVVLPAARLPMVRTAGMRTEELRDDTLSSSGET